eukprot:755709-Hanusia_phi.AAC.3
MLRVTTALAMVGAASSYMLSLPTPLHATARTTACTAASPNPAQSSLSSSRRSILQGIIVSGGAFLAGPVLADDRPKIPEDQLIEPPSQSCAQGIFLVASCPDGLTAVCLCWAVTFTQGLEASARSLRKGTR